MAYDDTPGMKTMPQIILAAMILVSSVLSSKDLILYEQTKLELHTNIALCCGTWVTENNLEQFAFPLCQSYSQIFMSAVDKITSIKRDTLAAGNKEYYYWSENGLFSRDRHFSLPEFSKLRSASAQGVRTISYEVVKQT